MKIEFKSYKLFKVKYYLKTTKFFVFYHGTNINLKNWIKIEQILKKSQLQQYKVYNTFLIKIIKNSIFKNIMTLIQGPIIIVYIKTPSNLTINKLIEVNPLLSFLSIRINNKFYAVSQIKNIKSISFVKNVIIFHKSLKMFLKIPYYKLKN